MSLKKVLIIVIIIFISNLVSAQSKSEKKQSEKLYEGTWVNKKTKRFIAFYYDDDYVTINDWTGSSNRNKNNNIDAYKALIEGDKLVILEENSDHHAPYCEIEILNHELIYKCNAGTNFTDGILLEDKSTDSTVFERIHKK